MDEKFTKMFEIGEQFKIYIKNVFSVSDKMLRNSVVVSVQRNGTIIIIKLGGYVMFCCDIPSLANPKIDLKPFHKDYFLLLESCNDGCCAINLSERKVHNWTDGKEILIDDYLCVGHDQMFIAFPKEEFVLTDFQCCDYDSRSQDGILSKKRKKALCKDTPNTSVVASINKNILQAKARIQSLESAIKEKQNLIKKSFVTFSDMSLDLVTNVSDAQSCLVPLLRNRGDSKPDCGSNEEVNKSHNNFTITKKWIRKCNQELIISCSIVNNNIDKYLIQDASCCAVLINSDTTSTSSTNKSLATTSENTKNQLRWKSDTESTFLTAIEVPRLAHLKLLRIALYLTYHVKGKAFCYYFDEFKVTRLDYLRMECVTVKDFGKRDTEDNIAFEFGMYKFCFVLKSKVSNLESVQSSFSRRLNCCNCSTIGNVTVLFLQNAEVRFQLGYRESQGTIFATTRDHVLNLLHEIDFIKPADVTFQLILGADTPKKLYTQLIAENRSMLSAVRSDLQNLQNQKQQDLDIIVLDSPPENTEKLDHQTTGVDYNLNAQFEMLKTNVSIANLFDSM